MAKKRARQTLQFNRDYAAFDYAARIAALTGAAAAPAPARPSTLPEHFTDLLKVEPTKDFELIPPHARAGKWEDHHEFHRSATKPSRSSFGVHCPDPPIALICPECDTRLPVADTGGGFLGFVGKRWRQCTYCGLTMTVHGSRLLWWR